MAEQDGIHAQHLRRPAGSLHCDRVRSVVSMVTSSPLVKLISRSYHFSTNKICISIAVTHDDGLSRSIAQHWSRY